MTQRIRLTLRLSTGDRHDVDYSILDHAVAQAWTRKLRHAGRLPLDSIYSQYHNQPPPPEPRLHAEITRDIQEITHLTGREIYPTRDRYDQTDCNRLHSLTVREQYNQDRSVRDIWHRLHRNVHKLEDIRYNYVPELLYADWGEAGGLLTTRFRTPPYDLYQDRLTPGVIYHHWQEFGKWPHRYWLDGDDPDVEHMISNCPPDLTFRPSFALCIRKGYHDHGTDPDFEQWFKTYKQAWLQRYGIPEQHCDTAAYGRGGIPLATPNDLRDLDFSLVEAISAVRLIK